MVFHNRGFFIMMIICLASIVQPSIAQKNKKGKKQRPISERTLREAEYVFTEAQKFFILEDYAKALVLFDKCLELNPKNAAVYFKIAEIQTNNESYKTALSNILTAIELDENNKYYYLLAANIYNVESRHAEAAATYETMLGKIEGTSNYYYELAAIYLYQKRYDAALSAYSRAEEALGVSEEISYQKQKIYLHLNQLNNAITEGEKLIDRYPQNPEHTLLLVGILSANGREPKAIALLTKLLKTDPDNGQALLLMADLQKNMGDIDGYQSTIDQIHENSNIDISIKVQLIAESIYQISQARSLNNPNKTLETNTLARADALEAQHPDNIQVLALYGDLLYSLERREEALAKYVKSLELDESNFQVWQNVLQIESDLGHNEALIAHAEQALEIFPNQAIIYMYSGLAHLQLKNYAEAASTLEHGKKLSIQNQTQIAIFSSLLGSAYNGSKDYPKSDNAYQQALNINPQDHQTLNNYSYFLSLRKENLEAAEKMARKVVSMSPDNATYLDTYAWVLYMRGKYEEAKTQIERAIEVGEPSAINFDHYGDILYRLGQVDQAVAQWKKARSLDKSINHIDEKIETRKIYE